MEIDSRHVIFGLGAALIASTIPLNVMVISGVATPAITTAAAAMSIAFYALPIITLAWAGYKAYQTADNKLENLLSVIGAILLFVGLILAVIWGYKGGTFHTEVGILMPTASVAQYMAYATTSLQIMALALGGLTVYLMNPKEDPSKLPQAQQ